ncbi:hypothetical protein [Zavarzinella formosa]|uniref:hypothetical protein n=1 Tax=Zavarzinella formosa TaxID=360055 RepID=UPI000315A476|nr:hypothetical protein [Zavarzinella formosa]
MSDLEAQMIAAGATVRGVNLAALGLCVEAVTVAAAPIIPKLAEIGKLAKERSGPEVRHFLTVWIEGMPLKSESNAGGQLGAKICRKTAVKGTIELALADAKPLPLPVIVTLTRLGRNPQDDDNIRGTLKAVRDVVAKWQGVDDGDRQLIRFRYRQRAAFRPGCVIQVRTRS